MSYILYYSPGAASMAVHWMLLELGVEFETRRGRGETGIAELVSDMWLTGFTKRMPNAVPYTATCSAACSSKCAMK